MQVTIDRSKWLRGEPEPGASKLRRSGDGKQCCIGFVCLVNGADPAQITDRGNPINVSITRFGSWDFSQDDNALFAAFVINDARVGCSFHGSSDGVRSLLRKFGGLTPIKDDADREARLTALLGSVGIDLVFVDGPVAP